MKKRAVIAGLVLGLLLAVAPAQASTTQAWTSYGFTSANPIGDRINAIATWGTKIFVGGTFTNAGGDANADYLAAYDTAAPNNGWTSISSSNPYVFSGEVKSLLVVGDRLFVGGSFSADVTNSLDECIRMLNLANSPPTWVNLAGGTTITGTNKVVNDIEVDTNAASSIFIAGGFASLGGPRYVARYDYVSGTYSTVGTGINYVDSTAQAQSIAQVGTTYYVGFSNVGNTKPLLQVINGAVSTTSLYWSTSGNWPNYYGGIKGVFDLRVLGTDLYVGGNFEDAGGSIPNFAKFDTTAGSVHNSAAWTAPVAGLQCDSGIQNSCISTIQLLNAEVYVGGFIGFGHINATQGSITQYLAGGGSSDGNAIAVLGSQLLIGGTFSDAGGLSTADTFVGLTPASTNQLDGFAMDIGSTDEIFASGTYAYTKSTTESSVVLTVNPKNTGSLLHYSTDGSVWNVISNSTLQTPSISLNNGSNDVRVRVQPAGVSGVARTYTISITRSAPVISPPLVIPTTPATEPAAASKPSQSYFVPARLKIKKAVKLNLKSAQGLSVTASASGSCKTKVVTRKVKKVKIPQYIELTAAKKPGSCYVRISNSGNDTYAAMAETFEVAIVKK